MWLLLFEAVVDSDIEAVYTFENLSDIIGANILQNRVSLYKANKYLLKERKRMLVSVPSVGYKLVDGMKQFSHAKGRHKKASYQIVLANTEATNLNVSAMTSQQKEEWQSFLALNGSLMAVMRQQVKNIAVASEISNNYVQDQFKKFEENMTSFQQKIDQLSKKLENNRNSSE